MELTTVPYTDGLDEAARLIDAAASPVVSVLDPRQGMELKTFRDAVLATAFDRPNVAGVLFASRWGGGGVVIT